METRGRRRVRTRSRGQALVEMALITPILLLLVGGIVQFGILFWGQNTLNQVARDTGRWAATSQLVCAGTATETDAAATAVVNRANAIAAQSSLIGYADGSWTSPENVQVSWQDSNGVVPATAPCPPNSNAEVRWVTVEINHHVPVIFPWIPGNGDLHTSTQFRMEPVSGQGG